MLSAAGGLESALRSVWEGMCLLGQAQSGEPYRLIGAAVALPSDLAPAEKMGLPLIGLHAPIHGYEEQLASRVDHCMAKLKPGRIFGRCNWFVTPSCALHWRADHPASEAFAGITADNAGARLFVRCERQTLRRLPQTSAILFTIGVYVTALTKLTPDNSARLVQALANLPAPEEKRRGDAHFAPALHNWVARHDHQIRRKN